MISEKEAYKIVVKSNHLPIAFMADGGSHYIFGFDDRKNRKKDSSTTFKAVEKSTGKLTNYIVDNFTEFFDMVENKSIDIEDFR